MKKSDPKNLLYYGDNLDVLCQHVKDESVDLIYLDPPFKSNQDYNVLFAEQDGTRSAAQIKAFVDTWRWDQAAEANYQTMVERGGKLAEALKAFRLFLGTTDMMAYVAMMAPRLVELHRVLKPVGSIYLHCDPAASHYLKILLDAVFAPENFQNEIVWKRHNARSTDAKWPRIHDVILFYSKSDTFTFNPVWVQGDTRKIPHTLITYQGKKYQTSDLTGPGVTQEGESGKPWHGFNPTDFGRHWANSEKERNEWDQAGLIHWPKPGKTGGFPRRRAEQPFDPENRLILVGDVWTDIDRINQSAKERLGYPTQKPELLLERIIKAGSNEGDVILDPFCGCGTAIAVAQRLHRQWMGIDITHLAITLIKHRLHSAFGNHILSTFKVVGEPTTLQDATVLATEDPYQFQWWALGLVGARPAEERKGSDKGIDGRLYFHDEGPGGNTKQVIFSVKAGKTGPSHVRDLRGVVQREKAEMGVLITMQSPSSQMRSEAASAGFYESPWTRKKHPKIQLLTIADLLNGKSLDMPPIQQVSQTFKKAPRAKAQSREVQPETIFEDESE